MTTQDYHNVLNIGLKVTVHNESCTITGHWYNGVIVLCGNETTFYNVDQLNYMIKKKILTF